MEMMDLAEWLLSSMGLLRIDEVSKTGDDEGFCVELGNEI